MADPNTPQFAVVKPLTAAEKKRLLRDLKWMAELAEEMCGGSYPPRCAEAIEAGHDFFIDDAQARVKQLATQIRGMIKSWPEK